MSTDYDALKAEADAARAMWDARYRLKELGWRDAVYCPRDGRALMFVEPGSAGIHEGHCDDQGQVWLHSHGDLWPSKPVLYRELKEQK